MGNSRAKILNVLNLVFNEGAFSNIAINNELKKGSISAKDKGLITEVVYGTIKYRYTIDQIIKLFVDKSLDKIDKGVLNIIRSSIYQIKFLDKVPDFAVVNEAVNIAKYKYGIGPSKFVNGVLRNYIRNKDKESSIVFNDFIDELCFKNSYERWMVELFIDQYGLEDAKKILLGLNATPGVTVRVNNLKTNFEDAFEELTSLGYELNEGVVCPEAIKIKKGKSIENNPVFKKGKITVQDESAMLVAPSMDLKENLLVLDLCSAPGGKTTHISEMMNNTGEIKAYDIHKNKLTLINQNAQRLGISNIKLNTMDASILKEDLINIADRVLIDVPCSGFGIIRKKPEIKWNKSLKDTEEIIKIQKNILINASKYVKNGGILLYSTCTLNKDENENNVNEFLRNNSNFKVEPIYFGNIDNFIYTKEGYLTIFPDKNMDGFFIAKLKRIK